MVTKFIVRTLCLILFLSFGSCDTDEPTSSSNSLGDKNQRITAPSFDKWLTTTDTDGFSIRVRFKTGGDKESNINAKVYWKAYTKKPESKPSKKELSTTETMRQHGAATYHKTGTKKGMTESIVFDKSHAGTRGGKYIYYYVECSNSKGSAESPIDYTVIKR